MNFTYIFEEDPVKEPIQGNLTWFIPNFNIPGHWMHTEDICKQRFLFPFSFQSTHHHFNQNKKIIKLLQNLLTILQPLNDDINT